MNPLEQMEQAVASLTAEGQVFALEDVDIRGYSYRSYINQPASLPEYLQSMLSHADKEWVVLGEERYSYGEGYQHGAEFAVALQQRFGVRKGDRVAIVMRNNPQWMMAFLGAAMAGAVVVPMNGWWTTEELEYGLEDCGATIVVADPQRAARFQPFAGRMGLQVIGVGDFSGLALEVADFMALCAEFAGAEPPPVSIDPEDDACIMYTSGSTGHPKGAVQTHRGIIAALFSWLLLGNATNLVMPPGTPDRSDPVMPPSDPKAPSDPKGSEGALGSEGGGSIPENGGSISGLGSEGGGSIPEGGGSIPDYPACALMTVPLFHATGSHSLFLLSLVVGRKIVLIHKWDVQEAMRLIEAERVTNFNGVPTMSAELQAAAKNSPYDLSSLKEIFAGGAARPPDQVKKITDSFKGSSAGIGYGLTETNALGAVNSGAFYLAKPNSTGRVVPAVTDFRILDEEGRELPVGERGEVCIHSPANVRGYWNKPEATAEAFIDGWFHSGDVGYLDEDGFLYIVDRIKDIIIRGGENISCIEVEAAISAHDAVEEVAVFGLPDERLGESVGAAVVLNEGGDLDAENLQGYLAEHLAAFKIPAHIWFHRDKLPRIASGKIFKRQLKADYAEQLAS
jgi:long-chain acyl-CoA synthetase